MAGKREVIVCRNQEEIFKRAADLFVDLVADSISSQGRFSVALSGGSTPKGMFSLLASDDYRNRVDWSKVHLFWGDERSVPPDHKDSNYRMANEAMISKVPIPPENVHRMRAEAADVNEGAAEYEQLLKKHFKLGDGEWPSFDLLLLGMGDDGHTASLFPGTKALAEKNKIVTANWVEKFNTNRVTFSAPAINNARVILFMAAGESKRGPLKEVLKGERNPDLYPSQLIEATDGKVIWMVDDAATGGEDY